MKGKKILLTGIAGFIGRNAATTFLGDQFDLTGIVRPKTSPAKLSGLNDNVRLEEIDLTDISRLKRFLNDKEFDVILHIGALRGGRRFPEDAYYKANVLATEQLATFAYKKGAVMIFCSSVGVYGAIPNELPANIHTEQQEDNYYHITKIKAEAIVLNLIMKGLKAHIVRPAITYGRDDYGFPYTLTKLIARKHFFLPDKTIKINLANINLLKALFFKLATTEYKKCKVYNVADKEPVSLKELADFISENIHGKPYMNNRCIPVEYFRMGERLAKRFGMVNLLNRLRLISYSWYYDVEDTFNELAIEPIYTIPSFKTVIDWYKGNDGIKEEKVSE